MSIDLNTLSRDFSIKMPGYLRHLAWRYANAQTVIYKRPIAVLQSSLETLLSGDVYTEDHVFHVVSDHMESKHFWRALHEALCYIKNWQYVSHPERMDALSYRELVVEELARYAIIVNFWYFPDAVSPEDMALMLAQYPHPHVAEYRRAVDNGFAGTFHEWIGAGEKGSGEILIIHDPT